MAGSKNISDLTKFALFVALIILLAVTPLGYISLGVISATTIQMPVIIGAVLFGWKKGALLGGVFGLTSIIKATIQPNATSFVFSPFVPVFGEEKGSLAALLVCFVPRIMIGVVAALVFKALSKTKIRKSLACSICGFCGSMTNTLLVMGGIYIFFGKSYSAANNIAYETLIATVMATITGAGLTEAIVSAVVCGAVCAALFKYLQNRRS
ncbi:MAG: ECF transporter S component [Oscillospiraceae bacterium]